MPWFRQNDLVPEPHPPFQGPVYTVGVNQDRDGIEVTLVLFRRDGAKVAFEFPPDWARELGAALIDQADACERLAKERAAP